MVGGDTLASDAMARMELTAMAPGLSSTRAAARLICGLRPGKAWVSVSIICLMRRISGQNNKYCNV